MAFRLRLLLAGILVGFGFTLLWTSTSTSAAGIPITLTTSPITLDLHITPGGSETQTLQFENSSSVSLPVTMEVQVFGADGTSGEAKITKTSPGDQSTNWVSFSPSSFTAQPNVWTSVKMTITLPKTASLGYYYAIIFKPTIPSSTAAHTTNIKGSNAILVLVDSNTSNEKRSVSVTNFSVSKHIYEYLPVNFSVTLHNGGNIYLPPSGDIFISRNSDMSHTIATIPFNQAGANVLPESNRIFTDNWSDGFPVFKPKLLDGVPIDNKLGQPEASLSWDFHNANSFRFGKYYAEIVLSYNDGISVKVIRSEVSFWVLPWLLMVIGFIIVVLMGVGIFTLIRQLLRRLRNNNKRTYRRR